MLRLFKVIFVVCCALVLLTALSPEEEALEDADFFPASYACPDTIFSFAAAVHWISEEWKKNALYDVGYPLLYSILITLPVLPFLCFMIPTKEALEQQLENECKRQQEIEIEQQQDNEHAQSQAEDEIESDSEADEEYFVPRLEPTNKICAESFVCSKSLSSIGERLAAIEFNKPELSAPHVVMETPPTVERQEGLFAVREEFPDLTTIATTDSFNRLKELADRICPESTLGKACVAVASGVVISYGLYRLFSK